MAEVKYRPVLMEWREARVILVAGVGGLALTWLLLGALDFAVAAWAGLWRP